MRIALVGPLAPWRGGLAQYLALLGEALARRAEVRALTFTRQYPAQLFPGGSQLDPAAPRPTFPVEALLDSIGPLSWRRTARRLERFAPGAVVLKWWMPFFAPAFASAVGPLRKRGTRVVLVCDNLLPHEKRPLDRELSAWMLRNSDGYLVMSESVERDLAALKPGAPYRRVPHPLYAQFDGGRFDRARARARLGLDPDGEVVLFFGYVRRYKGLDTLLEAWPAVRARRPATLVVAGDFYEDPAPYRALAAAAGAPAAVRLREGYQSAEAVEALARLGGALRRRGEDLEPLAPGRIMEKDPVPGPGHGPQAVGPAAGPLLRDRPDLGFVLAAEVGEQGNFEVEGAEPGGLVEDPADAGIPLSPLVGDDVVADRPHDGERPAGSAPIARRFVRGGRHGF